MLFICQLGSRRQIHHRLNTIHFARSLQAILESETVPHGDTVGNLCERIVLDELEKIPPKMVATLIRSKVLYPWRLLDQYFVIGIDGSETVSFSSRHCDSCLTRTQHGKTRYYHPVLEAKLITPNGFAFSVGSEFIENTHPGASKQDCEWKAFLRLAPKIKENFPKLPICLALDGLYAGGDIFGICKKFGWKFFVVLQDGDLPSVEREFAALTKFEPQNKLTWNTGKLASIRQEFSWANDIDYVDTKKNEYTLGVVRCLETKEGKTNTHQWITNFTISKANVAALCNQGGRLRWKIENEGFNAQKNGGYALEHPYSRNLNAFKAFYFLMQIAHLLFQLLAKGDLLRKAFPKGLGSLKNLAASILEAWRTRCVSPEELYAIQTQSIQIRFNSS